MAIRSFLAVLLLLAVAACAAPVCASDLASQLTQAKAAEEGKNLQAAIDILKNAVAEYPGDPGLSEAYYRIGLDSILLRDSGQDATACLNQAEDAFRNVVSKYPNRPEAAESQYRIGMIYMARRIPTEAHPNGIRQISRAIPEFQAVLDNYGSDPKWAQEAAIQLAALKLEFMLNGKATRDEVIAYAKEVGDKHGKDQTIACIARVLIAEAWFFDKEYTAAQPLVESIISDFSSQLKQVNWARFLLARCQELTGQTEPALATYEEVLKHVEAGEPCYSGANVVLPGSYYSKGACLETLGRKAEAHAAYEALMAKFPQSGDAKPAAARVTALDHQDEGR